MIQNKLLTHRCEGSLKHKLSIRFSKEFNNMTIPYDFETWRLFELEIDADYDSKYLSHVSEINFCPFCGEKLMKTLK